MNVCRIDMKRLEIVAQTGIIPHLLRLIGDEHPLRPLAFQLMCEFAQSTATVRDLLWKSGALLSYLEQITFHENPSWQIDALGALVSWLVHCNSKRV